MWVIPSRSRPHNLWRLISVMGETSADAPALVCIDDDDPVIGGYLELDLPKNWSFLHYPKRLPLSTIYNRAFKNFSDCIWYGFLADDVVPGPGGWEQKLISTAGRDGLACGENDDTAPHFVLGGDLVRDIGWLSLPGLDRIYIDTVWNDIAHERGVYRKVPGVNLEHYHFSNGKALMDSVYRKFNKEEDRMTYERWRVS